MSGHPHSIFSPKSTGINFRYINLKNIVYLFFFWFTSLSKDIRIMWQPLNQKGYYGKSGHLEQNTRFCSWWAEIPIFSFSIGLLQKDSYIADITILNGHYPHSMPIWWFCVDSVITWGFFCMIVNSFEL